MRIKSAVPFPLYALRDKWRTIQTLHEKGCVWITAHCSANLKEPPEIHQLPDVNGPSLALRLRASVLSRALAPTEGQVIKKLFVALDWIDHLFPKFLFPSFTHYTPPPDVRGHLLAPAFTVLANGNILQHFLGILSFIYQLRDWSIFRGRKIKISLRVTAVKMKSVCAWEGYFSLQLYQAIYKNAGQRFT